MKFCGVEFALFLISPFCFQERSSLLKRLGTLKDPEVIRTVAEGNDLEEPMNITGLETFSLSYKVCSSGIFSKLPPFCDFPLYLTFVVFVRNSLIWSIKCQYI